MTTSRNGSRRGAAAKKSRSGTETRQKTSYMGVRMYPEQRELLEQRAHERGFKSAQELVMHRMFHEDEAAAS